MATDRGRTLSWECQHRPRCADAACSYNPAMSGPVPSPKCGPDCSPGEPLIKHLILLGDRAEACTCTPDPDTGDLYDRDGWRCTHGG